MIVLIKCSTNRVGCDKQEVYQFDDNSTEEYLQEYADDLARDNAESYGIFDEEREEAEDSGIEFIEDECYNGSYEILDMTYDEALDEYGEVLEP